MANAVVLIVLADGLSGMAEGGDGAQHALVRFVGEGDRAPALPPIPAQAVQATVVARARVGVGGDESGWLSALLLLKLLLSKQGPQQRRIRMGNDAGGEIRGGVRTGIGWQLNGFRGKHVFHFHATPL